MTDTKERILDTAERLFSEQGYAATSLRSIIARAGVNLAAVHYHFRSLNAHDRYEGAHPRYCGTPVLRAGLRRHLSAQHHRQGGRESGCGPLSFPLQRGAAVVYRDAAN